MAFFCYIFFGVPDLPTYTDNTINSIKTRLTLSEVVQGYIPVVTRSGRNWAKCPFHGGGNERTPSFAINDKEGFYHCFGCNESGDMFTFVEKMDHVSFSEAVEILAKKAGVVLETKTGKAEKKDRDEIDTLYDLNKRIAGAFHYLLLNSPEAASAREYLSRRGISSGMIERFELGYAPSDTSWLERFLIKKGYSEDILRKSGLFSPNNYPYPMFACRLMFPVRSWQGRYIAFSGRDLTGRDNVPKYKNTSDTPIYSKRHNLFGIYEALDTLKKGDVPAVIVEGNFDVVSMHQAGVTSAVASLGTAFTEEQVKLLSRYVDRIDLMFDSDEAGQKSTDKAINLIHKAGLECSVHSLTGGKDASEILEKEGHEALYKAFENSENDFAYLVSKGIKTYNVQSGRGKSDFVKYLSPFLQSTVSSVERDSYIKTLSTMLSVGEEAIRADISSVEKPGDVAEEDERGIIGDAVPKKRRFNPAAVSIDLFAMLFLANHRDLFAEYRSRISFGDLKDREAQMIYMALENAMRNEISSNELFLTMITDEDARNDVATSFALDEYSAKSGRSALDEAADRISLRGMEERRDVLLNQLKSFSDSLDPDQLSEALLRKKELDEKISVLRNELFRSTEKEE